MIVVRCVMIPSTAEETLEALECSQTVQYAQLLVDLFTTTGRQEFLNTASELFQSLNAVTHEDYPRVLKHLGSLKVHTGGSRA